MYTYSGKIFRVIDGDTCVVMIDLGFKIFHKATLRLLDIDCPESRTRDLVEKARGKEATLFTKNAIDGKDVIVKTTKDKKGKFGRMLADVLYYEDGIELSLVEQLKLHGHEKEK